MNLLLPTKSDAFYNLYMGLSVTMIALMFLSAACRDRPRIIAARQLDRYRRTRRIQRNLLRQEQGQIHRGENEKVDDHLSCHSGDLLYLLLHSSARIDLGLIRHKREFERRLFRKRPPFLFLYLAAYISFYYGGAL